MKTGPLAAACVLAAAVLVTHLPLLGAGYVRDDHVAVRNAIVEAEACPPSSALVLGRRAGGPDAPPVRVASFALEPRDRRARSFPRIN